MKSSLVVFGLLFGILSNAEAVNANEGAGAPPRGQCLIKRGAWCVAPGPSKAVMTVTGSTSGDVWSLYFEPGRESVIEIIEPKGCLSGYSDGVTLNENSVRSVTVRGRRMTAYSVRLKKDGSCDLDVRVPTRADDPLERAHSWSFTVIRPCENRQCMGESLPVEIRNQVPRN